MPSFCVQCGTALEPDAQFCEQCGAQVGGKVSSRIFRPKRTFLLAMLSLAAVLGISALFLFVGGLSNFIEREMASVPAGEFYMGCNEQVDSECDSSEKPGRRVYVDTFRIDRTEVTVMAYRRCVQVGACTPPGTGSGCNWGQGGREEHPVNCVDWNQAQSYCRWAGKRLPTEAEWEKAARGTDGRTYPWGNQWEARKANTMGDEDGYPESAPVGSFPAGASPYEALDMSGNAWEWVQDWYSETYYRQGPDRNPTGPGSGQYRVLRGGSWWNAPRVARASDRYGNVPDYRAELFGFRCAQ